MVRKPADLFDRDWEWAELVRFVTDDAPGATLGIVSGRRRQGKSFLLQALCERTGGFFYEAVEATEAESLRHFGRQLAGHLGSPGDLAFPTWEAAIDALLHLGEQRPTTVVLDELPYLARAAPSLPSVIQAALAPRVATRRRSRTRLLLCGSALSFMGKLLAGTAPLRGRAGLDLVVQTFPYHLAARFWGLASDPHLAVLVHAVVGGTPAYRREFVAGDGPADRDDFDAWVVRRVLNPASPLFREGRYLLAEEPDLRDPALYHSVLAAVAEGRTTRSAIAATLQRAAADLSHPLAVLEDIGLLARTEDVLRRGRPTYTIREPIIRFSHAVMRPVWGRLQRPGAAARVWQEAQPRFHSLVVGPQFEQLCREWVAEGASPSFLGARPARVGAGVVNDRAGRAKIQLDVVALGEGRRRGRAPVLAIGEAKWGRTIGSADLARLQRAHQLLARRDDLDMSACRLLLFSGAGFDRSLAGAARQDEVRLLDVAALYDRREPARAS